MGDMGGIGDIDGEWGVWMERLYEWGPEGQIWIGGIWDKLKLVKAVAFKMLLTFDSCLITVACVPSCEKVQFCLVVRRCNSILNEVNEKK